MIWCLSWHRLGISICACVCVCANVCASVRLFLRIGGGPACERIVAVDAADGRVLGTITARR